MLLQLVESMLSRVMEEFDLRIANQNELVFSIHDCPNFLSFNKKGNSIVPLERWTVVGAWFSNPFIVFI